MTETSTPRGRDDRGSIPLALLAVIALSAIMGALAVTAVGSGEAARFDRQYTELVQAADAGAQLGESRLLRVHSQATLEGIAVPSGCTPTTWTACPVFESGTGTSDGFSYEWETRKVSALGYRVRATATAPGGLDRTVVIEVRDQPRFFLAAFSDRGFEMRGGNGADSYGSSAWYTGNGVVASNETIRLNGSSTSVDAVHLYNWDNNPDLNRCVHTGGSGCNDVRTMPEATLPSARFGPKLEVGGDLLDTAFIDEQLAACPTPILDYTASTYNGGSGVLGTAGTTTTLCFDAVTFDRNVTVNGTVNLYVAGNVLFSNGVNINCASGCAAGSSTPNARALQIFVDGPTNPVSDPPTLVRVGNHTNVAAGIYAPESTCEGNPSNAQAQVFGSLICRTISNQGGWQFHYDDRLSEQGSGEYRREAWREEASP